jgi:hypothetical protein
MPLALLVVVTMVFLVVFVNTQAAASEKCRHDETNEGHWLETEMRLSIAASSDSSGPSGMGGQPMLVHFTHTIDVVNKNTRDDAQQICGGSLNYHETGGENGLPLKASSGDTAFFVRVWKSDEDRHTGTVFDARAVGCIMYKGLKQKVFHYKVFLVAKIDGLEAQSYKYNVGKVVKCLSDDGNDVHLEKGTHRIHSVDHVMHVAPSKDHRPPGKMQSIAVVGDFGFPNAQVVLSVLEMDDYELLVHVGDASYASNAGGCYGYQEVDGSGNQHKCGWNCKFVPDDFKTCDGLDRQKQKDLAVYKRWFDAVEPISSRVPWMTTTGNHDNDLHWFLKFRPPLNESFLSVQKEELTPGLKKGLSPMSLEAVDMQSATSYNRNNQGRANELMKEPYYYSFHSGYVHFIAIGTEDNPINPYERRSENVAEFEALLAPGTPMRARFELHYGRESDQYKWLERNLQKASANRGKVPWVVVYTHRPMWHSSKHHKMCEGGGDWYGCLMRELYSPLFEKYGVNLVFSGHSHHYQRSKPMRNGLPVENGDGVTWVVCGTGGYQLTPQFIAEPDWMGFRQGTQFGYCKMDANETHLHFQHVALHKESQLTKKNPTISVLPSSLQEAAAMIDDMWIHAK